MIAFVRNSEWWRVLAVAGVVGAAAAVGCTLNPQPLPPETAGDATDAGKGGATNLGSDSGAVDGSTGNGGGDVDAASGDAGGAVPGTDAGASDGAADGAIEGGDASSDAGPSDAADGGG